MGVNIGPDPSVLLAYRNQNITWALALGELIDNAFDAGATQIRISSPGKRELVVTDNGKGCPDIVAMLTLGRHRKHDSTSLGRYGVGLKEAALWMWGTLKIRSVHSGIMRRCSIDWQSLVASGSWDVVDPSETEASGIDSGTVLVFSRTERHPPDWDRLAHQLSHTFASALWDGKQIVFEFPKKPAIVVKPFTPPPLEHVVQDVFEVDGKGVKLNAGIVLQGEKNPNPGFSYYHGHRCIETSSLGAGEHSTSRVYGQVILDRRWDLSKNKDGISHGREALGDAVFERCEEMLKAADKQASAIIAQDMIGDLQDRLNLAIGSITKKQVKGRRPNKAGKAGTVVPAATGKEHRLFKYVQPGNKGDGRSSGPRMFTVEWDEMDNTDAFGRYDVLGNRVYLNAANETMKRYNREKNRDALVLVCASLISEQEYSRRDKQARFAGMLDDQEQLTMCGILAKIASSAITQETTISEG